MIKFNKHPGPRLWWMLRRRLRKQTPSLILETTLQCKWTAFGRSQSLTCEWKRNRDVASSASGPPPPWATMKSCCCLINPLKSTLTLVSNDRGAHRSHLEGGEIRWIMIFVLMMCSVFLYSWSREGHISLVYSWWCSQDRYITEE